MFSSRRSVFAQPRRRFPWFQAIGILFAIFIVFAAGVVTGRAFPHFLGSPVPAPVTAAEF